MESLSLNSIQTAFLVICIRFANDDILLSAREHKSDMFHWTKRIIVFLIPLALATGYDRLRSFVANVEEYTRIIPEQDRANAEFRNATETLRATVEALETVPQGKYLCLTDFTPHM